MRNPTSCAPKTVTFDAASYSGHSAHGSAPSFTPTNCNALPFSPTLSVSVGAGPTTHAPSMTTTISQDKGEAGLKQAKVFLSDNVGPNLDALNHTCTLLQFRVNAAACPARSIVGKAAARSPYVASTLTGPVVVVAPGPKDLFARLGVDLHGPLSLQVVGSFIAENAGLGNEFNKLPDIPISDFALHFNGGNGGLLQTTVNLCAMPRQHFLASFDGFNRAHKQSTVTAKLNGCG
jgi:hypothetical protein